MFRYGWRRPRRRSAKRGKYKTMNGVPCKTEQEKKASKAVSNKKWRLAQKTKASKMLAEKKKLELSVMHKTSKATVTKKLVAQIAQQKEELAQLRAKVAKLEKPRVPRRSKTITTVERTTSWLTTLCSKKSTSAKKSTKSLSRCPASTVRTSLR